MNVVRLIGSLTLGLASVLFAVVVFVASLVANRRHVLRNEDRHVSAVPLVGSILGFLAVLLAPIGTFRDRLAWSWLPLAIEIGVVGLGAAYFRLSGLDRRAALQRSSRRTEGPPSSPRLE